jgi:hypothetical protein
MKLYYSRGADTPCDLGEGVDVQFSELFLLVEEAVSYTWERDNMSPYVGDPKQCKTIPRKWMVVTPAISPPPSPLSLAHESSSIKISMLLKLDLPEGEVEDELYTARIGLQRVHDSAASPWGKRDWMLGVRLFPGEPGVMVTMELVLGTLHIRVHRVRTRSDDEESVYDDVNWFRKYDDRGHRKFLACVPSIPTQWAARAGHGGTTISIVDDDCSDSDE